MTSHQNDSKQNGVVGGMCPPGGAKNISQKYFLFTWINECSPSPDEFVQMTGSIYVF